MFKITFENKNTNKTKIETSKLLLFSVVVLAYLVTIFVCVMVFITKDLSSLCYLIPSIFSACSISIGFYSWKAKTENKMKIEIQKIKEEQKLRKMYKDENIKINLEENNENLQNYGIYNEFNGGNG